MAWHVLACPEALAAGRVEGVQLPAIAIDDPIRLRQRRGTVPPRLDGGGVARSPPRRAIPGGERRRVKDWGPAEPWVRRGRGRRGVLLYQHIGVRLPDGQHPPPERHDGPAAPAALPDDMPIQGIDAKALGAVLHHHLVAVGRHAQAHQRVSDRYHIRQARFPAHRPIVEGKGTEIAIERCRDDAVFDAHEGKAAEGMATALCPARCAVSRVERTERSIARSDNEKFSIHRATYLPSRAW